AAGAGRGDRPGTRERRYRHVPPLRPLRPAGRGRCRGLAPGPPAPSRSPRLTRPPARCTMKPRRCPVKTRRPAVGLLRTLGRDLSTSDGSGTGVPAELMDGHTMETTTPSGAGVVPPLEPGYTWTRHALTQAVDLVTVPGYRDLRQIGRGGFSVVYRAYQERLERTGAVKILSGEFSDTRAGEAFLRELRLTTRLTGHPNVVTVLDHGLTNAGQPYIAMEYFQRGSLRDLLTARGPLPAPEVSRIGVKIAAALGA